MLEANTRTETRRKAETQKSATSSAGITSRRAMVFTTTLFSVHATERFSQLRRIALLATNLLASSVSSLRTAWSISGYPLREVQQLISLQTLKQTAALFQVLTDL